MTIKRPGQYPDVTLFPEDTSKSWEVSFLRNGIPMDLTDSTISVVILDDETQKAVVTVDMSDAADGVAMLSIDSATITLLGRYTTWRLSESPQYNTVLVQGRLVRQP